MEKFFIIVNIFFLFSMSISLRKILSIRVIYPIIMIHFFHIHTICEKFVKYNTVNRTKSNLCFILASLIM